MSQRLWLPLIILFLAAASVAGPLSSPTDLGEGLAGAWLPTVEGEPPLILHAGGTGTRGELRFRWRRFGKGRLRMDAAGVVSRPEVELQDEGKLTVKWKAGSVTYQRAPASFRVVPPDLEGAGSGGGTPWNHPKAYFSCVLPPKWSVEEIDADGMLLNPGLGRGDNLDAIPFLGWGVLEGDDLRRTPSQLIRSHEGEWRGELRKDGIKLRKAKAGPRRILVDGVPGAEQEWRGKAGDKDVRMWLGAIVKGEAFLFVAVVVTEDTADRYLPLAKQLLLSVKPTPPKRNRGLEGALEGRKILSSSFIGESSGPPDSFLWSYEFREGGVLRYFWSCSGGVGLDGVADLSGTEWGSYEVHGNEVFVFLESGQEVGDLVLDGGIPNSIDLAGARYRLQ